MKAVFTDKELEYIYRYLDFDIKPDLYRKIEIKIRKQVRRFAEHDKKYSTITRMRP